MSSSNPLTLSSDDSASSNSSLERWKKSYLSSNPSRGEDSSSLSSYISPYEDSDEETTSKTVKLPPLAVVRPEQMFQTLPLQTPPPSAAPSPAGPSLSSSVVREVVSGLACPKVYEWINMRGAQKVMPKWTLRKKL